MVNSGNRGEWAEIYIFLKFASEGKVFMADKNMQKLAHVYMNILKIFREEIPGERYQYIIGDPVQIWHNDNIEDTSVAVSILADYAGKTWNLIKHAEKGNYLFDEEIAQFLESIKINKLKSPPISKAKFFGDTNDIMMEVEDYRSGISSVLGFSCKSKIASEATLFNASKDNTNFRYQITGPMDDAKMAHFNGIYKNKRKKNKQTGIIEEVKEYAIIERMSYLSDIGCDLEFISTCGEIARRNLIQSGGIELPIIVAEMLRYYFFINKGKKENANVSKIISHLSKTDPAGYCFDDLGGMYRSKVGKMLYDMFTGMKFKSIWDGNQTVTGGYICVKDDGDVVAYHANVVNEFRDFLITQLALETPSASRHNYMNIEKEGNNYFINLNMQFRFAQSEFEQRKEQSKKK